jgi:hypothetical protein
MVLVLIVLLEGGQASRPAENKCAVLSVTLLSVLKMLTYCQRRRATIKDIPPFYTRRAVTHSKRVMPGSEPTSIWRKQPRLVQLIVAYCDCYASISVAELIISGLPQGPYSLMKRRTVKTLSTEPS